MKYPYPSFTEEWHNTSYDAISPTRPELSVANKTVIITGGGRGIGPEIAKAFAAAGASHIILIGRTQSTLSRTAETIEKEFGSSVSISTHVADIADEAAMAKAAEKIKEWDVLILNAGALADPQPIEKSEVTDWWRIFETNVKGAMVTTRALLPSRTPSAAIIGVNANLITLDVTEPISQGSSAYVCSKFAQAKMLEYVAAEHPDLFVVSAHPGVLATDMLKTTDPRGTVDKAYLDDMSLPSHFFVWLVSPEARFLRGKWVCANWDVDELKGKKEEIAGTRILDVNVHGWPYGDPMGAMLAQMGGGK